MHLQDGIRGRGLRDLSKASRLTLVGAGALVVAACGSSSTPAGSGTATNPGVPAGITVSAFTTDIGATMGLLKPLTAYATKGVNSLLIGVILPDTTSSTRWVNFDQPYLTAALADAGFNQSQFRIDNDSQLLQKLQKVWERHLLDGIAKLPAITQDDLIEVEDPTA